MSKVDSATAYRKSMREDFELPSGNVFVLKSPGKRTLDALMTLLLLGEGVKNLEGEEISDEKGRELFSKIAQEHPEAFENFADTMYMDMIVKPRISIEYTEKAGWLWIDEIDMLDSIALTKKLTEMVDIPKDKMEELFRAPDDPGSDDRSDSA